MHGQICVFCSENVRCLKLEVVSVPKPISVPKPMFRSNLLLKRLCLNPANAYISYARVDRFPEPSCADAKKESVVMCGNNMSEIRTRQVGG